MTLQAILNHLTSDTVASLRAFLPELTLCATIVALLASRLCNCRIKISAFLIALVGSGVGLYLAADRSFLTGAAEHTREIFTGLLIYDSLTVYFRTVLLLFAFLFVIFTKLSGIPDSDDAPDFFTLVLGATLGMCLMASANHLLMVFLGVEMASVPSYALAGLTKGRAKSSEAALKYAVFGAGAAGIMLYGISLLAGALGTAHLPTMAKQLATLLASGGAGEFSTVLTLGGLLLMVGLAFKLSAVPFHFWCPDVFEGATAEVNAFLSVASKAAALALLVRVVIGLGHVDSAPAALAFADPPAAVAEAETATDAAAPAVIPSTRQQQAPLAPVRRYMLGLIALLSAITCTFGNLAAYGQTNIKRLLAYSTIAHAGYLMMPVAAMVVLMGVNNPAAEKAVGSLCFYIGVYLFMNLGAFAVVAFVRNSLRSEEIADYAGLIRRAPGVVICFSAMLLSLLGLPPLAGFSAKVVIFSALVEAAKADPVVQFEMLGLLSLAGLNTAISLFYYLRVVKVMTIDPEPDNRLPADVPLVSLPGAFLVLLTVPVIVLGVWWDFLNRWVNAAAQNLFS